MCPWRPQQPGVSIIVVVYNMAREAPRSFFSLSSTYQRNVAADDYEVIVGDNGSTPPFDPAVFGKLKGNFRLIRYGPTWRLQNTTRCCQPNDGPCLAGIRPCFDRLDETPVRVMLATDSRVT